MTVVLCNKYCCRRGDPIIQGGYPYYTRFRCLTPYELMRRFILCIITLLSVYFAIVGAIAKQTQTGYATAIIALLTLYRVVVFDLIVIDVEHTSLPKAHLW